MGRKWRRRGGLWLALLAVVLLPGPGCSRAYYRRQADREVYQTLEGVANDPRWPLEGYTIQPDRRSRMHDPYPADCPPMPPDDPASHALMHYVDGKPGWPDWHAHGDAGVVESPDWELYLPRDEDGVVVIDQRGAMELALLHSPQYQQALENLYLAALDVTLERFQFDVQFFGGNQTRSTISGPLSGQGTESRTLNTDTDIRAQKLAITGAQLLADFANSVVWQFAGPDRYTSVNVLNFSLLQPLLRGAGRAVVMEQLTDAERALLANVRQLERFRRGFYLSIVAGGSPGPGPSRGGPGLGTVSFGPRSAGGYFGLLETQLRIRNQRANVMGFRDNVERLQAFYDAQRVSRFQLDELIRSLYSSQISLLGQINGYENQLDAYKITLGLPPRIQVRAEDPFLDRFNLIDPEVIQTQETVTLFLDELRDAEQPVTGAEERIAELIGRFRGHLDMVEEDLVRLVEALPERRASLRRLATREEFQRRDVDPGLLDISALEARVAEVQAEYARLRPKIEATLGTAQYRSGDYAGAVATLEKSIQQREGGEAEDWFVLAMAYWKAGRQDYARLWYQKAIDWVVANAPEDEPLGRLAAEAAQLTGLPNPLARPQAVPLPPPEGVAPPPEEAPPPTEGPGSPTRDPQRQRLIQLLTRMNSELTDLSLIQAGARLDAPTLVPVDLDPEEALEIARQNRLDWMNARAALVDQWRQIEVVADRLRSDLNLTFNGDLTQTSSTLTGTHNTIGRLQVGLEFDAPLTRLAERNAYRQVLISYQQARRQYYQFEDRVSEALRNTLRQIRLTQLQFELQREAVRADIRRVVQIQLQLEAPPRPGQQQLNLSEQTARNLVNSLNSLLGGQNTFLGFWLNYEVLRRSLDFDLGTMQLDEQGMWIDPGPIGPGGSGELPAPEAIPQGPQIAPGPVQASYRTPATPPDRGVPRRVVPAICRLPPVEGSGARGRVVR